MDGESSRNDKLESMLQDGSSDASNLQLEYLRKITYNFSEELLLGEGGFGKVYKGVLQNGETIAASIPGVKDRQFDNEAQHLMKLRHPNIVMLLGSCSETENIYVEYNGKYICAEKSERLLCLEYMPNGNLRGYLSDESSGLDWDTRYKIIEGICYGLNYLHERWKLNSPIIHMDLKPANILLDNDMVPKIADFGLSKIFGEEQTWTRTRTCEGTLGYMAPEYINRGIITKKLDIFSLGVLIIEIITGHKDYPDETVTSSQEYIERVLRNWRNRLEKSPGYTSLEVDSQQIRRCIHIGLNCVKLDRSKRPTTSQLIEILHGSESADSSVREEVRSPATSQIIETTHGSVSADSNDREESTEAEEAVLLRLSAQSASDNSAFAEVEKTVQSVEASRPATTREGAVVRPPVADEEPKSQVGEEAVQAVEASRPATTREEAVAWLAVADEEPNSQVEEEEAVQAAAVSRSATTRDGAVAWLAVADEEPKSQVEEEVVQAAEAWLAVADKNLAEEAGSDVDARADEFIEHFRRHLRMENGMNSLSAPSAAAAWPTYTVTGSNTGSKQLLKSVFKRFAFK